MVQREKRFFDRGARRFLWWFVFVVLFFFLFHLFIKWNNKRNFNNQEKQKDIFVQNVLSETQNKDTLCISHNGSLYKDFGFSEVKALAFAREVGLKHWHDEKSRLIVLVHEGDCFTVGWKKVPK
jgi:hypothetical protein